MKKLLLELGIIFLCIVISILYIAFSGRIVDQNKIQLSSLWESTAYLIFNPKVAVLFVTVICVFLFQSLRQVRLRFKNVMSNLLILTTSLFLFYYYSTRLYYDQDLRTLIINSGQGDADILAQIDLRQKVYWLFIFVFAVAIFTTLFFMIKKLKRKNRA